MRGGWGTALILLGACKAEIGQTNGTTIDAPDVIIDADIDAPGTFAPWSTPMMVPGASTAGAAEDDATLSYSGLELIFAKADPAIDAGRKHLYWMSRPSTSSMQWSAPLRLSFNIDGTSDETPRFSQDDKTLYFASSRTGTAGGLDIWSTTRPTIGVSTGWNVPALVAGINSTANDKWCMPCGGKYLMISQRAPSTTDDLWEGTMGQAPTLSNISDAATGDTGSFLVPDCLTAYFASSRSGTNRLYTTTRTAIGAMWGTPQLLPDFMTTGLAQEDPFLSNDQRTFVFAATTSGTNKDIYITTR
jgi:hypothetical protein